MNWNIQEIYRIFLKYGKKKIFDLYLSQILKEIGEKK